MSGHKKTTVTISADEYRRMQQSEDKLRTLDHDLPDLVTKLSQKSSAAVWKHLEEIEQRQRDYEATVQQLNPPAAEVEQRIGAYFMREQERLANHFDQTLTDRQDQLRGWFEQEQGVFQAQMGQIEQWMGESHRWLEEQSVTARAHAEQLGALMDEVELMDGRVAIIEDRATRYQQACQEWIDSAQTTIDFIMDHYDYERFAPGRLAALQMQVSQAGLNYTQGMFEAGVASAQAASLNLSLLRYELETRQAEWLYLHQAAWVEARRLHTLCVRRQNVPAVDLDGNELPLTIDVNYWTNDTLKEYSRRLRLLLKELESQPAPFSTEDLVSLVDVVLPDACDGIEETIFQARLQVINSQLRINIADLVVSALHTQGYRLEHSLYQQNDQRGGYEVRLVSQDGCEVVVEVEPVVGQLGQNELHLHSLDASQRTEHELKQRSLELSRALNRFGLKLNAMQADPAPYAPPAIPVQLSPSTRERSRVQVQ